MPHLSCEVLDECVVYFSLSGRFLVLQEARREAQHAQNAARVQEQARIRNKVSKRWKYQYSACVVFLRVLQTNPLTDMPLQTKTFRWDAHPKQPIIHGRLLVNPTLSTMSIPTKAPRIVGTGAHGSCYYGLACTHLGQENISRNSPEVIARRQGRQAAP